MPLPGKSGLLAALGIGLAAGFLTGRGFHPVPSRPPQGPASAPPRDPSEVEALRARLRDAEAKIALLDREIADQNERRLGLEASLQDAQTRLTGATLLTLQSAPSPFQSRLTTYMKGSKGGEEDLTRELLRSPGAQQDFAAVFARANAPEAVRLWEIASGAYLAREGLNGKTMAQMPGLKEALRDIQKRETKKLGLLENLLKKS